MAIDKKQASKIAGRFLEQFHTGVKVVDAIIKDEVWEVTVSVGISNKETKKVMIDSKDDIIINSLQQ